MRKFLHAFGVVAVVGFATAPAAVAQDAGPPTRIVAVTSFQVSFGPERADVISFLTEYFLPAYQLHPKVRNFRMLTHNWGSNGADVALVAEYDTFADIEAECGQPCDDYFAQHEAPEEGEAGYGDYQRKVQAFNRAYSNHRDEIYTTNMNRAVVEGQMQGRVGPAPAED
ncbi:MAG TPA: hypothetical protein VM778_05610 [Gemmatimonadota bacterium]|nr:hypothetical protein [Gemmatimonadota bacterium]